MGSFELGFGWIIQLVLIFCLFDLPGCGQGQVDAGEEGVLTQSVVGCTVSSVRYPTSETEFSHLYAGRGFLADGVHVGRDINLGEGTAIYPVACGTIRVYRSAEGYGTLVVAVEHHLATPITVANGVGERVSVQDFLSIYGHLRATTLRTGGARLPWREGDTVRPEQIIGYVQNAADNGDGEEHLHLGIRLQTMADAARVDPAAWFAGYDRDHVRRRWYADPALFMPALLHRAITASTATWHPPGTVLAIDGQFWLVASEGVIAPIPDDVLRDERFGARVVTGVPAEVACMTTAGLSFDRTNGHHLVRFDGSSAVYEYAEAPASQRYTFLAQQAFDSWGWVNSQVEVRSSAERTPFLASYRDVGSRRLREGTLVKATGRSDVYVVSQGTRRPIFDWPTFLALGYDESWIIEVDSSVLDVLAGPLGEVIRPEDLRRCRSAPTSPPVMDAGVAPMDASVPIDVSAGVDVGIDATVDAVTDVGLRDVPTYPDVPSSGPSIDAGVSFVDASRDAASDIGTDLGRDAGIDSMPTILDGGVCSDPVPHDAGTTFMDAGGLDAGLSPVSDAGVTDVSDAPPPSGGGVPSGAVMRYEFRLAADSEGWRPTEPYNLRDHWWVPIRCLNAAGDSTRMVAQGGGWYRCDTAEIYRVFVGTFFSPSHLTSGDVGNIPTIDNWPRLCNPRLGVEWRISELPSGRELYHGSSSDLPCVNEGTNSRHQLP
jgi:hypothetical protein